MEKEEEAHPYDGILSSYKKNETLIHAARNMNLSKNMMLK